MKKYIIFLTDSEFKKNSKLLWRTIKITKCIIEISAIFFMVWIIWSRITYDVSNAFCYDDNLMQWLPVINATFSDFIHTGRLGFWNFYLMGGINILDTGIYSILNPLMICGFAIYKILGISNTITICIYLTVSVAMSIYYYVFRKNGFSTLCSFVILYCLLACSSFYNFSHWYYVFNNLLIGALVLLYFSKMYDGKQKYYFLGIILGESIYLGNVQYTVMWYMAIGFIILFDALFSHKFCKIKLLISNVCVGLFINLPQVLLNYRGSLGTVFEGKNAGFFGNALKLQSIILHGIFPDNLIEIFTHREFTELWFTSHFYFTGVLFICFLLAIGLLVKKGIKNNSILSAHVICAIIFMLWSLGKKGGVAWLLFNLPIISSFRQLQKVYYIFIPLLVGILLFTLKEKKYKEMIVLGGVSLPQLIFQGYPIPAEI